MLISVIFFFTFGIIAVNLLKGKYYECRIESVGAVSDDAWFSDRGVTINNKYDCYNYGGIWMRNDSNFDNIFHAMLTLFQMAITVGWARQMYLGSWSREIGMTRDRIEVDSGSMTMITIFFIIYIVVCSFFILNMFVGVVIATYNREKEKLGGSWLLTDRQKEWLECKLVLVEAQPKYHHRRPKEKWRQPCFDLVAKNEYFDRFIQVCIVLNTLVLCNKWYG